MIRQNRTGTTPDPGHSGPVRPVSTPGPADQPPAPQEPATGDAPVRMRLIGTPAQVDLALRRLPQAFSSVEDVTEPRPCRGLPGKVRVYASVRF